MDGENRRLWRWYRKEVEKVRRSRKRELPEKEYERKLSEDGSGNVLLRIPKSLCKSLRMRKGDVIKIEIYKPKSLSSGALIIKPMGYLYDEEFDKKFKKKAQKGR